MSTLLARITASTRAISLATAASRILGFVRDLLIARLFGTGAQAQAFVVAFRFPNLLRDLVGEGAVTSAIVPVLSATKATRSPEAFWHVVAASCVRVAVVAGVLGCVGIVAAPWLVRLMAPGFLQDPEKFALTVRLTRILFPFLTLVAVWAFLGGVLNSVHRFGLPAAGPVVLNLVMIAGCLWVAPRVEPPVIGVVWAVMAGGLAQVMMLLPTSFAVGFRWQWVWRDPAASEMGRLLMPRLFGTAVYQAAVFLNTILASLPLAGAGAVAALYFANRLVQLPLALFATASSQASLPMLSERAAVNDLGTFRATLTGVLRLVLCESLPAAVGLFLLATPIIHVCFQRGAFDVSSTLITASALRWLTIGLLAYAATKVLTSAFYALKDTRTPVRLAAEALVVNGLLAVALLPVMQVAGLAFATAVSSLLNAWRLLRALERRLGGALWPNLTGLFWRVSLASAIMGAGCWMMWQQLTPHLSPLVALSVTIGSGIVIYGLTCAALHVTELTSIVRWVRAPNPQPSSSG
ncbi:MAG: murein biosynthesis integral membrane protein MurJ [Candidatus Omnitrophica bacterium]|nr:murein biosynthesis integral membrane protein MurJ [Candidatus Omnitrophota bacterium]